MSDKEANANVRVRAATAILDTGLRMVEATEVLERIEALERAIL